MKGLDIEGLDEGIREAVELLNYHGFKTFESCEGGEGHCFQRPTIRFFGNEFDLIRAYELCETLKLNVYEAKRVYRKTPVYSEVDRGAEIGECWESPFNEITFVIHQSSGTIFLSC